LTAPGQRSLRRADRERSIVESARRFFTTGGYERTALADVAREIGIAEGTVYTYFPSKRALLHRVIADFYEPLIAEVDTTVKGIAGFRNRIRYLIWRQLRAFVDEPGLCYLIIRELQPGWDSYDSIVVSLARRYTAVAVGVTEQAIRAGEARPATSPTMVRAVLYGAVENIAWRLTFRHKPIDVEQIADELTGLLCDGVTPAPADIAAPLGALVVEMRDYLAAMRVSAAPKRKKGSAP